MQSGNNIEAYASGPYNAVLIGSGGIDSTVLLHHLVKELGAKVLVVGFKYGQRHSRELTCLTRQFSDLNGQASLRIMALDTLEQIGGSALTDTHIAVPNIKEVVGDPQPVTYVPFRNMFFLTIAAMLAEVNNVQDVYFGAQMHDMYGYWDTTDSFLEAMNAVTQQNRRHPIAIKAPLIRMSKTEVVALGLNLGVAFNNTWSCYNGQLVACGTCPTCAERLKAFKNNQTNDPIQYANGINNGMFMIGEGGRRNA